MNRVRVILVSLVMVGAVIFAAAGKDTSGYSTPKKSTEAGTVMNETVVEETIALPVEDRVLVPNEKLLVLAILEKELERIHNLNPLDLETYSEVRTEIERNQEKIHRILAMTGGGL